MTPERRPKRRTASSPSGPSLWYRKETSTNSTRPDTEGKGSGSAGSGMSVWRSSTSNTRSKETSDVANSTLEFEIADSGP